MRPNATDCDGHYNYSHIIYQTVMIGLLWHCCDVLHLSSLRIVANTYVQPLREDSRLPSPTYQHNILHHWSLQVRLGILSYWLASTWYQVAVLLRSTEYVRTTEIKPVFLIFLAIMTFKVSRFDFVSSFLTEPQSTQGAFVVTGIWYLVHTSSQHWCVSSVVKKLLAD